jgi:hypothetical protein
LFFRFYSDKQVKVIGKQTVSVKICNWLGMLVTLFQEVTVVVFGQK